MVNARAGQPLFRVAAAAVEDQVHQPGGAHPLGRLRIVGRNAGQGGDIVFKGARLQRRVRGHQPHPRPSQVPHGMDALGVAFLHQDHFPPVLQQRDGRPLRIARLHQFLDDLAGSNGHGRPACDIEIAHLHHAMLQLFIGDGRAGGIEPIDQGLVFKFCQILGPDILERRMKVALGGKHQIAGAHLGVDIIEDIGRGIVQIGSQRTLIRRPIQQGRGIRLPASR